jgi:hypothetical protein
LHVVTRSWAHTVSCLVMCFSQYLACWYYYYYYYNHHHHHHPCYHLYAVYLQLYTWNKPCF